MSRIVETNYGNPVRAYTANLQGLVTHDGSDETILYFEEATPNNGIPGLKVILEGGDRATVSEMLSPSQHEWDDHYGRAEIVGREEGYNNGFHDGVVKGRADVRKKVTEALVEYPL